MAAQRDTAWVGIDVGKTHHWACVVDAEGKALLSVKVANDEAEIEALLAKTGSLLTGSAYVQVAATATWPARLALRLPNVVR